ncbi:hypothetical protein [Solimonas marina]|uniref:Ig-like domain-containing protein n=1 Tax=Solimonas marina TaxID=2714601 RepID=A0A969W6K1_9GAMM|nr:hypothetical protein [Solimonas marina]NKF21342.1 hypothetical protein [Solimonas marina]
MKRARRARAMLWATTLALVVGTAHAAPPSRTIAQMAQDEGWNADGGATPEGPPRLSRRVPRDFPLPPLSHDLQTDGIAPIVSVACSVGDAEAFYETWFHNHGWHIDKRMKAQGLIGYVACDAASGQCVNVSATASDDGRQPSRVTLMFYQQTPAPAP